MTRTSHHKDLNAVEAKVSVQLPGTVDFQNAPNEIQFMPPGRHLISASRAGKPATLEVNVTPNGAQRVAAMHAKYVEAADQGEGDRPYFDFNHDDQEASAHPEGFHWGGDHPRLGGIRAKVRWTGAGKSAVVGRDYERFSPSFYMDDQSGEITGISVNCGGLVNRAAFQRIAPVMSKSAEFDVLVTPASFVAKAKELAKAKNLDLVQAADYLARTDPYSYACYRAESFGMPRPDAAKFPQPAYASLGYRTEFFIRARALADAIGVNEAKAIDILAHEQPALYLRYRSQLGLGNQRREAEEIADIQARTVDSAFFSRAKQIAATRAIDISHAFPIAARELPEAVDRARPLN